MVVRICAAFALVLAACSPDFDAAPAQPDEVASVERPIVGGSATADYLAVPQIRISFDDGTGANCTGTLISPKVVLTASHCVDPESGVEIKGIEARFGPVSLSKSTEVESIPVADYFWYPTWSFEGDDIALLLLEHDAQAEPIPYNTTSLTNSDIGRDLTLVGWGITDDGRSDDGVKRIVDGPLVDFDNSKLLAYGDTQRTTCSGDSGGPGFLTVGGVEKVVSITSFHTGGCGTYVGGSHGTRVAAYKNLIANYIADNDIPIPPTVTFTMPKDGETLRSGFPIRVDAQDDTRVDKVEFYINGELSSTGTSAPFADFGEGLAAGPATIEARAYDNRGDMTSATITVNVDPGAAVGEACTGNEDCASDLCATLGSDSLCTQVCTTDAECPNGTVCREDGGACWPASSGGGGCNAGGGALPLSAAGLLLFFALGLRRRRHLPGRY